MASRASVLIPSDASIAGSRVIPYSRTTRCLRSRSDDRLGRGERSCKRQAVRVEELDQGSDFPFGISRVGDAEEVVGARSEVQDWLRNRREHGRWQILELPLELAGRLIDHPDNRVDGERVIPGASIEAEPGHKPVSQFEREYVPAPLFPTTSYECSLRS